MTMARDHKSIYARRNEAAKALGYRNYSDQRKQRAAGTTLPTDTRARPDRRAVRPLPDGRRVVSVPEGARDARSVGAGMRNADPTADVTVTVKFQGAQGELETQITKDAASWVDLFDGMDWDIFDGIADALDGEAGYGGGWTGGAVSGVSVTF